MQKTFPQLIGIAGSFAGGKDTLAEYLTKEFGYIHVSTGDLVRQKAMELRGSIERPVLHEVADMLRHKYGAGYVIELALKKSEQFPDARGLLITGMRSLGEAKSVRQHGGLIVFVDADIKIRYGRMKKRQRDNETQLSIEQFQQNEASEWYSGPGDADFNLRGIKEMADIRLENNISLEAFLRDALQQLGLNK